MNPFAHVDWRSSASRYVFIIMYLASAAISALFFASAMPNLFVSANSALPGWAGPVTSAIVGVGFMEAAVLAWNYKVKYTPLRGGQLVLAWMGLLTSLAMSVITSFAAVMAFVGDNSGRISGAVVDFATGNGVALYIALQLVIVSVFYFLFDEVRVENRARTNTRITASNPSAAELSRPTSGAQGLPETLRAPVTNPQNQRQKNNRPR